MLGLIVRSDVYIIVLCYACKNVSVSLLKCRFLLLFSVRLDKQVPWAPIDTHIERTFQLTYLLSSNLFFRLDRHLHHQLSTSAPVHRDSFVSVHTLAWWYHQGSIRNRLAHVVVFNCDWINQRERERDEEVRTRSNNTLIVDRLITSLAVRQIKYSLMNNSDTSKRFRFSRTLAALPFTRLFRRAIVI